MTNSLTKLALAAALGLTLIFTISCGEHSLEELLGLDESSSSSEESYLPSSTSRVSSSSLSGNSQPNSSPSGVSSSSRSGNSNSSPSGASSSSRSGNSSPSSSPSGNGQGFVFDENSQVYERACYYDEYAEYICNPLPYAGNGSIKAGGLKVGTVADGIVSLQLPTIPDQNLDYFLDEEEAAYYCTDYEANIKAFSTAFTFAGDEYTADLGISNENDNRGIVYWYFSKAGKISCDWANDYSDYSSKKMNLNVNIGWNKIYYKKTIVDEEYNYTTEYTTSNILTRPVMWFIKR